MRCCWTPNICGRYLWIGEPLNNWKLSGMSMFKLHAPLGPRVCSRLHKNLPSCIIFYIITKNIETTSESHLHVYTCSYTNNQNIYLYTKNHIYIYNIIYISRIISIYISYLYHYQVPKVGSTKFASFDPLSIPKAWVWYLKNPENVWWRPQFMALHGEKDGNMMGKWW